MSDKDILLVSSSDLQRVGLGLFRGANKMAMVFLNEVINRTQDQKFSLLSTQNIIKDICQHGDSFKGLEGAEKAIMYSVLLKNRANF